MPRSAFARVLGGLLLCWLIAGPAFAQADRESSEIAPATVPSVRGIAAQSVMPQRWTIVQTQVHNPTDQEKRLRVIFRFDDGGQRQFVREFSVPPRAQRFVPIPIRAPAAPQNSPGIDVEAILSAAGADAEHNRTNATMIFLQDPVQYVAISDVEPRAEQAAAALRIVRERQGFAGSISHMRPNAAHRQDVAWDGVAVLGIMAEKTYFDAAQRDALRSWLAGGGKLVVFADQTDPQTMRELLPAAWTIQPVGHATFNTVTLKAGPDARSTGGDVAPPADLGVVDVEEPIGMTRVVAPGFQTLVEANGWPALLYRPYGRGSVIVVTLGGRGWTDPSARAAHGQLAALLSTTTAMTRMADAAEVLNDPAAVQFVSDQIGYKIVPRSALAIVLVVFALLVIAGAVWWWRGGQLERLGALAAALALAATAVLVIMGQRQRQEIEPTAAELQLVRTEPGRLDARVDGMMALYHPTGSQVDVIGVKGGYVWPAAQGARTVRIANEDVGQWRWLDLSLPSGTVQPLTFSGGADLSRPIAMNLRFNEQGLAGTIDWPEEAAAPQDLLLTTPAANLRITAEHEENTSRLTINAADDVLPRGEIQSSAVLGQAQQNRAIILEPLLERPPFDEPTLLAWTASVSTGIETDPPLGRRGDALWLIPLRIEPSEPGARVYVPWPLMDMQPVREKALVGNMLLSPIYRPSEREFQETFNPSAFVARFQVPPQVQPLKLEAAKVHLEMTAIGRPVKLMLRDASGGWTEFATLQSPDGPRVIDIPAEALAKAQLDETGGLLIAFEVGRTAAGAGDLMSSSMWQVRRFGVEVQGVVQNNSNSQLSVSRP